MPNDTTKSNREPAATFAHEWTIKIKADSKRGAMDAVWQCWEAWSCDSEPVGGACPASMGNNMNYDVKKDL